MEIDWGAKETEARYEDMISTLIKRIHPTAQRIDGSGGDEGRDLQVVEDNGLIIYELKSFTGRLSCGGRKQQISRSLNRAAFHRPGAWRLVVPIDPTPRELEWFEKLGNRQPFDCQWYGLTWLNSEIAKRPDLPRYFLQGHDRKVLEILRELNAEQGATACSRMALGQIRSVQRRLNESDPFFLYELTTRCNDNSQIEGSVMAVHTADGRIDVIPRYPTALDDRPITVKVQFPNPSNGHDPISVLEQSIDYGESVTISPDIVSRVSIDAPGGLSAEMQNATIQLAPLEESISQPLILHATILGRDGVSFLGTHEFLLQRRKRGRRGAVLFGTDSTELINLTIKLRTDRSPLNITLNYDYKEVLPGVARRATEWLEKLTPPNKIRIEVGSPLSTVGQSDILQPAIQEGICGLFKAFELTQERAGVYFRVPHDITPDESEQILLAGRWLNGEKVKFTWNRMKFTGTDIAEVLTRLSAEPGGSIALVQEVVFSFRGRELRLGYLARKIQATVENISDVKKAIDEGCVEVPVVLRPGKSNVGFEWMLDRQDEPDSKIITT